MSKSNNAMIICVKNGKKIIHKLHWYNKNIILNKFLTYKNHVIQIPEDIEWIHFENCEFQDLDKKEIKTSSNTTCIFENCTFSNDRLLSRNLFISGGKIELINPNFINVDALFIRNKSDYLQNDELEWIDTYEGEVTVKFDKKYNKKIDYLEVVADKVNIFNNDAINDLHIRGNIINLNKNFNLEHCSLKGNKVVIGDRKELDTNIFVNYPVFHIRAKEKIELKNCVIEAKESVAIQALNHLTITTPSEVEIENFTIKSKRIIFGEKIYYIDKIKKYATTKDFEKFLEKSDDTLCSKDKSIKKEITLQEENFLKSTLNEKIPEQTTTTKRKR